MRRIIHDFMYYNRDVEHNLAGPLKTALTETEWDLLQQIAKAANELRMPLYVVGGVPRDLILGKPIGDFDFVVEGKAEKLANLLRSKYGGKVTVHGRFGTAKWNLRDSRVEHRGSDGQWRAIDLVTARSETYKHPAALPSVEPGTIEDDLRRRDFTINAVAVRLDSLHFGEVRDDFQGLEDLQAGIIRVLHEGSFREDPTRMYRAVRYEQRYGFQIADETLGLMGDGRPFIENLSAQRIRHELDLILEEALAVAMLDRLAELQLLSPIHPALTFDDEGARRITGVERRQPLSLPKWPAHELRWACWLLVHPQAEIESVNQRLHFSAALVKAILAAAQLWGDLDSLAGAAAGRWVERLDAAPLMAVYAAYLAVRPGDLREALEQYLVRWRHVKPKATGHELKRMGIKPGAEYKRILDELRRAWLEGEILSDGDEEQYLQYLTRNEEDR
jgi:tRNA nucleotidyltransferase (CCA-adding enzyme)